MELSQNNIIRSLTELGIRHEALIRLLSAVTRLTGVPITAPDRRSASLMIATILIEELPNIDNCSLLLFKPGDGLLRLVAARGANDLLDDNDRGYNTDLAFKPDEGAAGRVFASNEPLFWNQGEDDRSVIKKNEFMVTPVSLACLPLSAMDRSLGVLNISFASAEPFIHTRKRSLILLGMVVANIILSFEFKSEVEQTVKTLNITVQDLQREIKERVKTEAALAKSEESYRQLFDNAGEGILVVTGKGIVLANNRAGEIVELDPKKLIGNRLIDFIHPSDRDRVEDLVRSCLRGEEAPGLYVARALLKNDLTKWLEFRIGLIDWEGEPAMLGLYADITERTRARLQVAEQDQRIKSVFEMSPLGIALVDAGGYLAEINDHFGKLLGYRSDEITQVTLIDLTHPEDREAVGQLVQKILTGKIDHYEIEQRYLTKSGQILDAVTRARAILNEHGDLLYWIGLIEDISERKRNEEQIAYQAFHDPLTGLPNRFLFNDRLDMAMAQAVRKKHLLAVLFLDLDHFKTVNDSLGHSTGDELLKATARRLLRWIRDEDTVARIGGDEFLILLQNIDAPETAIRVSQRIHESLARPFTIEGRNLYTSASMGLTFFPTDGRDVKTLMTNADLAMYRAKEEGRNTYRVFTPSMNRKIKRRLLMENNLRRALENNELLLYYQPKINCRTGLVSGVEALIRWRRPGVGLILPDEFIPLAEDIGVIVAIGEWAMRQACFQAAEWRAQGMTDLGMAVNLSPRQFRELNLADTVADCLSRSGLPADGLKLEVTENAVMYDVESAIRTMKQLSDLGVGLSLDDFGRGYSSLYYLKRFPISELKIDRSFVSDVPGDADSSSIVDTIISISRSLDIQVVAEGVETAEQLEFLRQRSCDQMQGFLFSPPAAARDIPGLFNSGPLFP